MAKSFTVLGNLCISHLLPKNKNSLLIFVKCIKERFKHMERINHILCVCFMVSVRYLRMNGEDTQLVGKMKRSHAEE